MSTLGEVNVQRWSARVVQLVGASLLAAGVLCTVGASSSRWFQALAERIRKADDATPERQERVHAVCIFYAASCLALGATVFARRRRIAEWLSQTPAELSAIKNRLRMCCGSPAGQVESSDRGFPQAAAGASHGRFRWWLLVLLFAGIVLVPGLLLRLRFLNGPANYDEAYSLLNYAQRPWYEAVSDYSSPNNHLLNSLLMHVCYRIWGQQEWAMRLPVLAAGVALIAAVYLWGRSWWDERGALLAAGLVACAPMLVTYSTEARGYILVAIAVVTMDGVLGLARPGRTPLAWFAAWVSMVLGFWAMPTMLYAALGCGVAYGLAGCLVGAGWLGECWSRAKALAWLFLIGAWAVTMLYAPGFVFRGAHVAHNPVMSRLSVERFFRRWPQVVAEVADWWTQGPIPWPVWAGLSILGVLSLRRASGGLWLRMVCPLAVSLSIMTVQGVAPPARVFLPLSPWFYLLVGGGAASIVRHFLPTTKIAYYVLIDYALIAGLFGLTAWYVVRTPVFFTRGPSDTLYPLVEPAIRELKTQLQTTPNQPDRLLVPLPCDIPSGYYLAKHGMPIPVNGQPQSNEAIWLITTEGRRPLDTLNDVVVWLEDWNERLEPWRKVQDYGNLALWRSDR